METFRKWLNKPKADDKSLLARFYHADRLLTTVASELDSFDGRDEPDRCSRLVTRLRQHQDKVLAITNLIIDELLGSERQARAFRAKFPEEVLQDNLAGQLWFGAECLAAGSSILNREAESKAMRPMAQAVTKSLATVRILLRDQCLRNNVPNSETLQLDLNDAVTENLREHLRIFDQLFAEFELSYVSAMVQVKSNHEYDMQQWICVLFSEALQRALKIKLIEQEKVDAFDPGLMFSIPRLAIVAGLVIFPEGPLNMDMPKEELSEMFRPFRTPLIKIRDLLRNLSEAELQQLEKLLLSANEDINATKTAAGKSSIEAPSNDQQKSSNSESGGNDEGLKVSEVDENSSGASTPVTTQTTKSSAAADATKQESKQQKKSYLRCSRVKLSYGMRRASPSISPVSSTSSFQSAKSYDTASTTTATDVVSENDEDDEDDLSTNNNDDESDDHNKDTDFNSDSDSDCEETVPKVAAEEDIVSADCATGFLIPNTNLGNLYQIQDIPLTGDFIEHEVGMAAGTLVEELDSERPTTSAAVARALSASNGSDVTSTSEVSTTLTCMPSINTTDAHLSDDVANADKHQHQHRHHHHHHHHHHLYHHHQHHGRHRRHRHHQRRRTRNSESSFDTDSDEHIERRSRTKSLTKTEGTTLSEESPVTEVAESEPQDAAVLMRRLKYRNTEILLHRLFVCISGVADQLQTNFASDLRQILRGVFLMNSTPAEEEEEEIIIPAKSKDIDLFEFRASESDVIQGGSGSNQSIYSAEEVNPELDNVFSGNEMRRSTEGSTVGLAVNGDDVTHSAGIVRSRSLGDQPEQAGPQHQQQQQHQPQPQQRSRNNSLGSNTPSSNTSSQTSSEQSSPVSARNVNMNNNNINNNNHYNNSDTGSNNSNYSNYNQMQSTTDINNGNAYGSESAAVPLSPPAWIPDIKAPRCMLCLTTFTPFRRRHHCRNCGGVFCGNCSSFTVPLPKYGFTKAVRVCRSCYTNVITISTSGTSGISTHTSQQRAQTAGGS